MLGNTILDKAKSYIGLTESPKNSNNVIFNTDYYGHQVSGSSYPWCCTFVWDIFRMCEASKYFYGGKKTASCTTLMNYYKKNHPDWVITDVTKASAGDIVLFQFDKDKYADHVGIFDHSISDTYYVTVEGNTSSSDKGSQDNGGCVASKTRKKSQLMCIIHIPFEDAPKKQNPYKEPTTVVRYNSTKVNVVSEDVKWVQWELVEDGYQLEIDGKFGKLTLAAVKDYQSKHGLVVDGIVGSKTKESMKTV